MFDLTGSAEPHTEAHEAAEQRLSFRRRLLMLVGPALAVALAVPAVLAWAGAYVSFHQTAIRTLDTEVQEMLAEVRIAGDTLDLSTYAWQEAHHRLAVRRVDPIFVQVFDEKRRLVRQSPNVDSVRTSFPDQLLAAQTPPRTLPSLRTFDVGGRTFYYLTQPIPGPDSQPAGFVQVARAVPGFSSTLWTLGVGLIGLWGVLTGGLLVLMDWASRRVSQPLRRVTAVARSITSDDLDTRVEVPRHADRETATLAHTLNALLDRVEAHVDALRTFTSNAAHELQTPLTVLRGHVEIALRRDRPAEAYRETLELLDDRLGSFVRTLRALLTLTRLDRGASFDTERVDLRALVAEEIESFRNRAEKQGLALTLDTTRSACPVDAQPDLLRDAVRNLVDNALKYTSEGGITVSVSADDDAVHLTCRDTGLGIPEDELELVGSRFFRGAGAADAGGDGSGLGLSIVRRIVERHGGRLQVTSEQGEGTAFRITLPR